MIKKKLFNEVLATSYSIIPVADITRNGLQDKQYVPIIRYANYVTEVNIELMKIVDEGFIILDIALMHVYGSSCVVRLFVTYNNFVKKTHVVSLSSNPSIFNQYCSVYKDENKTLYIRLKYPVFYSFRVIGGINFELINKNTNIDITQLENVVIQ